MTGVTPSLYDADIGLFKQSQDGYHPWYQHNINFNDYGQGPQPAHLVNGHHPTVPNQQQEGYNNSDQMTSNMEQNQFPLSIALLSTKQPEETYSNKMKTMLTGDKNGSSNSNGNGDKAYRCRPGEKACQRCKSKGYRCIIEAKNPKVYKRDHLLTEIRQKDTIIETLLKQLHNPYLATPHSIGKYFKSVSPSDANSPDVLAWLSHLKSGVQMGVEHSTGANKEDSGRFTHEQQYDLLACSEVHEHEDIQTPSIGLKSAHVAVIFRPEGKATSQTENETERESFQYVAVCEAQKISPEPSSLYHCLVSAKYADVRFARPGFGLGNLMGLDYPEILALRLVTVEDAEQLFDM
ncbi:hypothetical protein F5146DRAFT_1142281 [Armillaria mellea]|nr:hypothetical protein F5146DRAFT_1142281 [Armillaria mellea]